MQKSLAWARMLLRAGPMVRVVPGIDTYFRVLQCCRKPCHGVWRRTHASAGGTDASLNDCSNHSAPSMMMRVQVLTLAAAIGLTGVSGAAGRAHAQDRASEITIEASILRGTLGYARAIAGQTLIGLEAGFGFPELDRTLIPEQDEETGGPQFVEILHARRATVCPRCSEARTFSQ